MSWAASEWKDGLPSNVLQKVNDLEVHLERSVKEKSQKQLQIVTLEQTVEKYKKKLDEEKINAASLKREVQTSSELGIALDKKLTKALQDLTNKDQQTMAYQNQLDAQRRQHQQEHDKLKELENELQKVQTRTKLGLTHDEVVLLQQKILDSEIQRIKQDELIKALEEKVKAGSSSDRHFQADYSGDAFQSLQKNYDALAEMNAKLELELKEKACRGPDSSRVDEDLKNTFQKQIDELHMDLTESKALNLTLESKVKQLERHCHNTEATRTALEERMKERENQRCIDLNQQIQTLEKEHDEALLNLKQERMAHQMSDSYLEASENIKRTLEQELKDLKKKLEGQSLEGAQEMKKLREQLASRDRTISILEESNAQMQKNAPSLLEKSEMGDFHQLETNMKQLQLLVKSKDLMLDQMSKAQKEYENQIQILGNRVQLASENSVMLDERCQLYEREANKKTIEIENLKLKVSTLEEEIEEHNSNIRKLKKTISMKDSFIQSLMAMDKNDGRNWSTKIQEIGKRWEDAENRAFDLETLAKRLQEQLRLQNVSARDSNVVADFKSKDGDDAKKLHQELKQKESQLENMQKQMATLSSESGFSPGKIEKLLDYYMEDFKKKYAENEPRERGDISILEKKISELSQQKEHAEKSLKDFKKKYEMDKNDSFANVQRQLDLALNEVTKKDKMYREVEEELKAYAGFASEMENMHHDIKERDERIFQLENRIDCEMRMREEKEEALKSIQNKMRTQLVEIEEREVQVANVKRNQEEADSTIQYMKSVQIDLQNELQDKESKHQIVQAELVKLQSVFDETEVANKGLHLKMDELNVHIKKLVKEKEALESEIQSQKMDSLKKKELLHTAEKSVSSWKEKANQIMTDSNSLTMELEKKERYIVAQQIKINKLVQYTEDQEVYIQSLSYQLKNLQKEIKDKEKRSGLFGLNPGYSNKDERPTKILEAELNALKEILEHKNKQVDKTRLLVEERDGSIQFLRTLLITLQNSAEVQDKKTKGLENQVIITENEIKSLDLKTLELEKRVKELLKENDEKYFKLNTVDTEMEIMRREQEDKKLRIQNLRMQMHTMQGKLESTMKEKDEKKGTISTLRSQIQNLQNKIQSSQKERDDKRVCIQTLQTELQVLQDEIDVLRKIKDKKERKIQMLNAQLGAIKSDLDERDRRLRNMERDVSTAQKNVCESKMTIEELNAQLSRAEEEHQQATQTVLKLQHELSQLKQKAEVDDEVRRPRELKSHIEILVKEMEGWQTQLQIAQQEWEEKEEVFHKLAGQMHQVQKQLSEKKKLLELLEIDMVNTGMDQGKDQALCCLQMETRMLQNEAEEKEVALLEATQQLHGTEELKQNIEKEVNQLLKEMETVQTEYHTINNQELPTSSEKMEVSSSHKQHPVERFQKQIEILKNNIHDLNEKLEVTEFEKFELEQAREMLLAENVNLTAAVKKQDGCDELCSKYRQEIELHKKEKKQADIRIQVLETNVDQLNNEKNAISNDLETEKSAHIITRKECESLKQLIVNHQELNLHAIEAHDKEIGELHNKIEVIESNNMDLESQIIGIETDRDKLLFENESLKAMTSETLQTLEEECKRREQLETKLKALENEMTLQNESCSNLKMEKENLLLALAENTQELEKAHLETNEIKKTRDDLQNKIETKAKELNDLVLLLLQLTKTAIDAGKQELDDECGIVKERMNNLSNENKWLGELHCTLNNYVFELDQQKEANAATALANAELLEKESTLTKAVDDLKAKEVAMAGQFQDLSLQKEQLQMELGEKENSLQHVMKEKTELDAELRSEKSGKEKFNEQLKEMMSLLNKEVEGELTFNGLHDEICNVIKEKKDSEFNLQLQFSTVNHLQTEKNDLTNQLQVIQHAADEANNKNEQLLQQLHGKQADLESLKADYEKLQDACQLQSGRLVELETRNQSLMSEIDVRQSDLASLQNAHEMLANQLQDKEILCEEIKMAHEHKQNELLGLMEDAEHLKLQLAERMAMINELELQNADLADQTNDMKEEIAKNEELFQTQLAGAENLRSELEASVQNSAEEVENLKSINDRLNNEKVAQQREMEELLKSKEDLDAALACNVEKLAKITQELADLKLSNASVLADLQSKDENLLELHNKHHELMMEIACKDSQLQDLKLITDKTTEEHMLCQEELLCAHNNYSAMLDEVAQKEDENRNLSALKKDLCDQLDKLQKECNNCQESNEGFQHEIMDLTRANENLLMQASEKETRLAEMQLSNETLASDLKCIREKFDSMNSAYVSLDESLKQKEVESMASNAKLQMRQDQVLELQEKLNDTFQLMTENHQVDESITDAMNESYQEKLAEMIKNSNHLETNYLKKEEELNEIIVANSKLRNEVNEKDKQINHLESVHADLEQRLRNSEKEISGLTSLGESLQAEKVNKEQELIQLQTLHASLVCDLDMQKLELEKCQTLMESVKVELSVKEDECTGLVKIKGGLEEEITAYEKSVLQLKSNQDELQLEMEQKRQCLVESNRINEDLNTSLLRIQKAFEELNLFHENLKQKHTALAETHQLDNEKLCLKSRQLEDLIQECLEKDQELAHLESIKLLHDKLKQEYENLSAKNRDDCAMLTEKCKRLEQLQLEIESRKEDVARLEGIHSVYENLQQDHERLMEKIEIDNDIISEKNDLLMNLKQDLEQKEQELAQLKLNEEDLTSRLTNKTEELVNLNGLQEKTNAELAKQCEEYIIAKGQFEDLQLSFAVREKELIEAFKEKSDLASLLDVKEKQLCELDGLFKQASSDLEKQECKLEENRELNEQLKVDLANKEDIIAEGNATIDDLLNQLQTKEKAIIELEANNMELENRIEEQTTSLTNYEEDLRSLAFINEEKISELNVVVNSLKTSLDFKEKEYQNLDASCKELMLLSKDPNAQRLENEELNQDLKRIVESKDLVIAEIKASNEDLTKQLLAAASDLKQLEAVREDLLVKIDGFENELTAARELALELNSALKEKEDLIAAQKNFQAQIEAKEEDVKMLQESCSSLERELSLQNQLKVENDLQKQDLFEKIESKLVTMETTNENLCRNVAEQMKEKEDLCLERETLIKQINVQEEKLKKLEGALQESDTANIILNEVKVVLSGKLAEQEDAVAQLVTDKSKLLEQSSVQEKQLLEIENERRGLCEKVASLLESCRELESAHKKVTFDKIMKEEELKALQEKLESENTLALALRKEFEDVCKQKESLHAIIERKEIEIESMFQIRSNFDDKVRSQEDKLSRVMNENEMLQNQLQNLEENDQWLDFKLQSATALLEGQKEPAECACEQDSQTEISIDRI